MSLVKTLYAAHNELHIHKNERKLPEFCNLIDRLCGSVRMTRPKYFFLLYFLLVSSGFCFSTQLTFEAIHCFSCDVSNLHNHAIHRDLFDSVYEMSEPVAVKQGIRVWRMNSPAQGLPLLCPAANFFPYECHSGTRNTIYVFTFTRYTTTQRS